MAYIDFGTWSQEYGQPRWAADFRSRDHLVPGPVKLVASQFPYHGQVVVTAPSGAIAAATSITVTALSGAIPLGTILDFTGTGEYARVSANAPAGATSISVDALDAAIEAADTATYVPTNAKRYIASGTVVGRTLAERDAGTGFGPADAADDFTRILAFSIEDVDKNNDGVLYRPGSVVKENLLPEVLAGTLAAGVLTDVRAAYVCERGVA